MDNMNENHFIWVAGPSSEAAVEAGTDVGTEAVLVAETGFIA